MKYANFGFEGKYVYSSDYSGGLFTWNLETGEVTTIKAHNSMVRISNSFYSPFINTLLIFIVIFYIDPSHFSKPHK